MVVSSDFLKLVRAYVEALVHPSARGDAHSLPRHFFFIASRLSISLIAFCALPVCLAIRGVPTHLEALAYGWLGLPLLLALYVSRTGKFEGGEVASAVSLAMPAGLAAAAAGLGGFPLWAALVPLEVILFCSWRAVFVTAASACISFAAGLTLGAALPTRSGSIDPATLSLLGGLAVAGYFALIAIAARAIFRGDVLREAARTARYRLVAENVGELVTRHGRNGAVALASPAAEMLLGVPPGALMGHGFFDRVHVADRPAFLTALSEAAVAKRPVVVEYRLRRESDDARASQTFVWVETHFKPDDFPVSMPAKPQIIAATKDVSARKAAELALAEARGQVEQANEAKHRFLATVSHELRTPLNAIIGFSEILTNASGNPAANYQHEYAKLIRDSGEHLLAVVNSILDVSRIESAQFTIRPKAFSPRALVESCIEMMALEAQRKGVLLSAELATISDLVADERALRQVVLNLLSNAIKFTGRGGEVMLGARAEGEEFVLSVSDSGIGIAESDLKQLGNPFFQVHAAYDRPYEGSGLGLSVVKGLVDLHGGKIEIRSRLGEGTNVIVRLPLDCRPKAAQSVESTPRRSEKVRRRA